MNVVPDNQDDHVFDGESELRVIFERSVPEISPLEIDDLIANAKQVTTIEPVRRARVPRRSLLALTGVVACTLAGFTVVWLRPANSFAQVQANVEATKSVRYVVRAVGERANDDVRHARMIIKELEHVRRKTQESLEMASMDEREQLTAKLHQAEQMGKEAEEYLKDRGTKAPVEQFFVLGRYRQRHERTTPRGRLVDIVNKRTGKSLLVDHARKVVTVFATQTLIDRKGNRTETELKEEPDLTVDFYSSIRDVPDTAKKLAKTQMINGSEHIGFEHAQVKGPYTWTRTFWIDPKTKLPSRIDVRARSDDSFYAPSDSVIENIEFDVPLAESMFSTEVPDGYTVKKAGLVSLD